MSMCPFLAARWRGLMPLGSDGFGSNIAAHILLLRRSWTTYNTHTHTQRNLLAQLGWPWKSALIKRNWPRRVRIRRPGPEGFFQRDLWCRGWTGAATASHSTKKTQSLTWHYKHILYVRSQYAHVLRVGLCRCFLKQVGILFSFCLFDFIQFNVKKNIKARTKFGRKIY